MMLEPLSKLNRDVIEVSARQEVPREDNRAAC